MSTPILERKCARRHCEVRFTPKRYDGKYCSKKCCHNASRRQRRNNVGHDRIPTWMGKPIIEPLKAPMCHGQALSFGSDPHTGRGTQYCRICGERPIEVHGQRTYSQGIEREEAIKAFVERTHQQVDGKRQGLRNWQNDFRIVSKAMREKIDAA